MRYDVRLMLLEYKNILYSLIFKKIVILPNDWQNDPKIKLKITSFGKKNESKHINIKKFLTNFIQKNKIEIQTLRKNSKNILILCAKNKHYDNGIKNFINRTIIFFNKKLKQNNEIFFHLKKHPSDDDQVRFNDLNNLIVFPIEHIPIEFFDLFGFDYIISPPNTSLVNIKTNNLFNINNLFYYDIKQTHLAKQIEVMNKYNINKIKI